MNYKVWSRKLETNILRVYESARSYEREDGMLWYQRAHEHAQSLAARYNLTIEQACGVIAAISPGSAWGRNLIDAETLCEAFSRGKRLPFTVGSYGRRNIVKASRILQGDPPLDVLPPTGPKVRAFYQCMLNPTECFEVCIDRHAKCLALDVIEARDAAAIVTRTQYRCLAWHYTVLARRLDILPSQLQAVCWCVWHRIIDEYESSAMTFDFHD